MTEQIIEAVDRVAEFPLSGRVVPEIRQESIREVVLGNYRIVYRVNPDNIEIATVFHASRLFSLLSDQ